MTFFSQIDQVFRHHEIFAQFDLSVSCTCSCHASAHARHVLAFVVSRVSTNNYLHNNELYRDNRDIYYRYQNGFYERKF